MYKQFAKREIDRKLFVMYSVLFLIQRGNMDLQEFIFTSL